MFEILEWVQKEGLRATENSGIKKAPGGNLKIVSRSTEINEDKRYGGAIGKVNVEGR